MAYAESRKMGDPSKKHRGINFTVCLCLVRVDRGHLLWKRQSEALSMGQRGKAFEWLEMYSDLAATNKFIPFPLILNSKHLVNECLPLQLR